MRFCSRGFLWVLVGARGSLRIALWLFVGVSGLPVGARRCTSVPCGLLGDPLGFVVCFYRLPSGSPWVSSWSSVGDQWVCRGVSVSLCFWLYFGGPPWVSAGCLAGRASAKAPPNHRGRPPTAPPNARRPLCGAATRSRELHLGHSVGPSLWAARMTPPAHQCPQWARLVRASSGLAAPSHETTTYPVAGAPLESSA